jgi:hypothetical protein
MGFLLLVISLVYIMNNVVEFITGTEQAVKVPLSAFENFT